MIDIFIILDSTSEKSSPLSSTSSSPVPSTSRNRIEVHKIVNRYVGYLGYFMKKILFLFFLMLMRRQDHVNIKWNKICSLSNHHYIFRHITRSSVFVYINCLLLYTLIYGKENWCTIYIFIETFNSIQYFHLLLLCSIQTFDTSISFNL